MTKIIRSKQFGCFEMKESKAWGKYLMPVEDPEGQDVTEDEVEGFLIKDNFPKLPAELWAPYIKLAFQFCNPAAKKHGELEVSVLLMRSEGDFNRWKILVPTQVVTGGSVEANFVKSCDLVTGEEYEEFPPPGWVHAGSSHSHNTMAAFFSSVDDKSELGVPGLHIVVGKIDQKKRCYDTKASIVLLKQRKILPIDHVVDTSPLKANFHPNCLRYISIKETKRSKKERYRTAPGMSVLEKLGILDDNVILDLDESSDMPSDTNAWWERFQQSKEGSSNDPSEDTADMPALLASEGDMLEPPPIDEIDEDERESIMRFLKQRHSGK